MLGVAHEVCRRLKQGETVDQVNQQLAAAPDVNMTGAMSFSSNVILSDPDCR
jgi:hypothetical protein